MGTERASDARPRGTNLHGWRQIAPRDLASVNLSIHRIVKLRGILEQLAARGAQRVSAQWARLERASFPLPRAVFRWSWSKVEAGNSVNFELALNAGSEGCTHQLIQTPRTKDVPTCKLHWACEGAWAKNGSTVRTRKQQGRRPGVQSPRHWGFPN